MLHLRYILSGGFPVSGFSWYHRKNRFMDIQLCHQRSTQYGIYLSWYNVNRQYWICEQQGKYIREVCHLVQ